MTIDLAFPDFEELWAQTKIPLEGGSAVEVLFNTPPSLGSGCHLEIQLDVEFSLAIWDIQGRDDVRVQIESEEQPIEFGVLLSGCISSDVNGSWNRARTLVSGRRSKNYIMPKKLSAPD